MKSRLQRLLARVRIYCDAERGPEGPLAEHLRIQPHMLSSWLAGRNERNGENTLAIQEWLQKQEQESRP